MDLNIQPRCALCQLPIQRLLVEPEGKLLCKRNTVGAGWPLPGGRLVVCGWYGWYKFSVEEELFYDELQREGRATV